MSSRLSSTQDEYPKNVVPLRSESDRIANALRIAQHRRFQALVQSLHASKERHAREWMSFEWTAAELVESK